MKTITATVAWRRDEQTFTDNRYSRRHSWTFDGGAEVTGSSSPDVVPVPLSDPAAVDPEEALLASASSCHMLWFLSIAARRGYLVDDYCDRPLAELARDDGGKTGISIVTLRPEVTFSGSPQPSDSEIEAMHRDAHDHCFIANSLKSEIICNPVR